MRIPDLPLDPAQIAEFTRCGYWTETTSNDALEHLAGAAPDRLAIVDGRMRLGYGDYFRRAERLAAYLAGLGLGADDVVAIQLPNWNEFPVAVNAAMLRGLRRGLRAGLRWRGYGGVTVTGVTVTVYFIFSPGVTGVTVTVHFIFSPAN